MEERSIYLKNVNILQNEISRLQKLVDGTTKNSEFRQSHTTKRMCHNQNKYGTQEDPVNQKSTISAVRKCGEKINQKFSKLFNSPKPCHTKIIDNPLTSSTKSVVILPMRKDLVKVIYPKGTFINYKELYQYVNDKNIGINNETWNDNRLAINSTKYSPSLNIGSEPFFREQLHKASHTECKENPKTKRGRKPNPNGKFPCPSCSNFYASKASLKTHIKTQHPIQTPSNAGVH